MKFREELLAPFAPVSCDDRTDDRFWAELGLIEMSGRLDAPACVSVYICIIYQGGNDSNRSQKQKSNPPKLNVR